MNIPTPTRPRAGAMPFALAAAALLAAALTSGTARAAPPAANGEALFKMQCAACHATTAGKNGIGPSLAGLSGRKAGSAPGFAYSPAMKKSNLKWDKTSLDRFLTDPRKTVPGTKMIYAGQKDSAKRSALVRYLLTR